MTNRRRIAEGIAFLALLLICFGYLGATMGAANMINTITKTAHDLLLNTVFYIMAITVLVGAFSALLVEFGVVLLIEKALAPLMRPIFGLPGVAALGGVLCFLSDNPAILSLAGKKGFRSYFRKRELYSLTNFGTAFGMGLIVVTFMMGRGFYAEAGFGLAGALVGSVVSTRLMQAFLRRAGEDGWAEPEVEREAYDAAEAVGAKPDSVFIRFLNAVLDGGKTGVEAGLAIIPGVLIIATMVMMLTWGPADPAAGYRGLAYEGVPLLPALGRLLAPAFDLLFGFADPAAVAFPITSLGAVGAALGLLPKFAEQGILAGNDVAVFTAMGMCWSGYLSTHTGMLDALGARRHIGKAVLAHTLGGLTAGVAAHYLYLAASLLG